MYSFILNMWIMKRIKEEHVQAYVVKNFITQEQANMILETPQDILRWGGINDYNSWCFKKTIRIY